ncbi:hypothetical protein [Novosphingobium sp. 9U]|uniref:hypothetical protein n=1 Tax=Novosphingobium sp. 9U TaxID=2653158 RepID=UPI001F19045A|nr:hypothetical protein [Novosphingobium sp. 9U]
MARWGRRDGQGVRHAAILSAVSFAIVLPALCGVWGFVGDAAVHLRWQAVFAPLVWSGVLYPRWIPTLNQSLGSPVFFFYPPMLQWLSSLFLPILPSALQTPQRLALGIWLISTLGAFGCLRWLRAMDLSPRAALFGSLVFLAMPYRAFFDFYQRAALAELAGIAVMPWLLFGARQLARGKRGGFACYAASVAAILYCHLPAALIGLLFSTGWLLVEFGRGDRAVLWRGALASVAGILVAAPCIVPALGLLDYLTDKTAMFGLRNRPTNWLLLSGAPWIDPAMHLMALVLTVGGIAMAAAFAWLGWWARGRGMRPYIVYLAGSVALIALLNTEASRWFWSLPTPLSRIQFPFRLFGVQVVALAGLSGLALAQAYARSPRLARLLWGLVPVLLVFDAGLIAVQALRQRDKHLPGIAEILAESRDSSEYVLGATIGQPNPIRGAVLSGAGDVRSYQLGHRAVSMVVEARSPAVVALHQFNFTGWSCRVDGAAWSEPSRALASSAMATCKVPAGRHRVDARLEVTELERGAWLAAIVGLALVAASLLVGRSRASPAEPRSGD